MNPADLLPPELLDEDSFLDSAAQLEQSARALDLEDWIVQRLKHPEREITVNVPLRRDLGDAFTCVAYRVQHFRDRGGCLGPVLLARDAHPALLRPLALHMTLQCALLELPLGGSAGAIVCDPAQLSESELRQLVRDYLAPLRDLDNDIFAPAEYATAWTSHELGSAAIVGKPAAVGGLPDSPAAIAAGWLALISNLLAPGRVPRPGPGLARAGASSLSQPPATSDKPLATLHGCRVALQGFGPSAAALARLLHNAGARIIALADNSGGLFAECGLDLDAISAHHAKHGMIFGFHAADPVCNADVLESDCDLLITAAAQHQLSAQNAPRIRAPLILEAVYNAVTPAARRNLASRGIMLIPDLLAAAPATLAWFAEWQHGLQYAVPEQAHIESVIRDAMTAALRRVTAASIARGWPFSDACHLLALEKISAKIRLTR